MPVNGLAALVGKQGACYARPVIGSAVFVMLDVVMSQ